jgi:hypothetical protein
LSALASDMLDKNNLIITTFASIAASLQGAITVCGATQCQMSGVAMADNKIVRTIGNVKRDATKNEKKM